MIILDKQKWVAAHFLLQVAQKLVRTPTKSYKNGDELRQYLTDSIEQENIDIDII
jgi:hypothetical protein